MVYTLGSYPVISEYGFSDEPGRWDHWPSGFILTGGADDGVDGRVVVAPGDIVITPFKRYVTSPIELTIEGGVIQDIRGGFDADLLSDYMAQFNDPNAYGIAHIGWARSCAAPPGRRRRGGPGCRRRDRSAPGSDDINPFRLAHEIYVEPLNTARATSSHWPSSLSCWNSP